MEVTLIGMGLGDPTTLTAQAVRALEGADGLIGARRLVEGLNLGREVPRYPATKGTEILEILEILRRSGLERPCVLYSGDTGFYSGARSLTALLEKEGIPFRVLPGLSSVQYLAARLGRPWQDWKLVSAHGTRCDPVAAVLEGREAFFLTGGELGPGSCARPCGMPGWATSGQWWVRSCPTRRNGSPGGRRRSLPRGPSPPSASCWWRGRSAPGRRSPPGSRTRTSCGMRSP